MINDVHARFRALGLSCLLLGACTAFGQRIVPVDPVDQPALAQKLRNIV